jgi:hypothetical protein
MPLNRIWPFETPLCFVNECNIWAELNPVSWENAMAMVQKERECKAFVPWQQGYTPKEHKEMMDRKAMLEWQTNRDEAYRKERDERYRVDREWREAQSKINREWRFREFVVAVVALIVVVLASVIGALISREGQPVINFTGITPPNVTVQQK